MRQLTFREFIPVYEDVNADIANLQKQIADIDLKIQRQLKPLQDQKNRLNTILAQKYKQRRTELQQQETQSKQSTTQQTTNATSQTQPSTPV